MTIKDREDVYKIIDLLQQAGALSLTLQQAHILRTVNTKLHDLAERGA